MPSIGLKSMPAEVLHEIFTNLCWYHCLQEWPFPAEVPPYCRIPRPQLYEEVLESRNNLYNVCKTSRRFCDVAQPILYHLCFHDRDDAEGCMQFLRTILERPDLAQRVDYVVSNIPLLIHDGHMNILKEILHKKRIWLPLGWGGRFESDVYGLSIQSFRHGFLTDLVLDSAPHVSKISLQCDGTVSYGRYTPTCVQFPALKTLEVTYMEADDRDPHSTQDESFGLQSIKCLLKKAPYLENLTVMLCNEIPANLSLPYLTSLSLFQSIIPRGHLSNIVKACPKLSNLELLWLGGNADSIPPRCILTVKDIASEARSRKSTLQQLKIKMADNSWLTNPRRAYMATTLMGFSRLTKLNLEGMYPDEFIARSSGADLFITLLPESIECLSLRKLPWLLYLAVLQVPECAKRGRFRNLGHFDVCFKPDILYVRGLSVVRDAEMRAHFDDEQEELQERDHEHCRGNHYLMRPLRPVRQHPASGLW